MDEFDRHLKTFEHVANSKLTKHYEFGWVNATCQTNFSSHFDAAPENLPMVIAYLPKNKKYVKMFASYERENISIFLERVIQGNTALLDFDNERMYLRNNLNCQEIFEEQNFKSDREEMDEDIVKEMLAEAQRKREQFELERTKMLELQAEADASNVNSKKDL